MTTVTDICNAAISHCGTRSKITSITEGSPEANACLNHFQFVRDSTLRAADWDFARRTQGLAQLTCTVQRWTYEFAIPIDCLRIRRLNDTPLLLLPETFYEIAADADSTGSYVNVLFANASPMAAIYTAQVTDPQRWDAGFVDAVQYGLAARICFELTGKEERVRALTQLWQATLREAAAENANQSSAPNRTYMPEALAARGYADGLAALGAVYPVGPWW